MPVLDKPDEEATILAYVLNGGKQLQAWRTAHPDSKASDAAASVMASKLFKQDKSRIRIAELQAEVAKQSTVHAALTLEAHVKKLLELRGIAENAGNLSAALKAEELLGHLGQHYVKRSHVTGEVNHDHTHSTEPVSDTVKWIEGVLRAGQTGKAKAPLPN